MDREIEPEITHAASMRLIHLTRAGLALALLYVVVSFGGEAPICPQGQDRCGITSFWELLMVGNGALLGGFGLLSVVYGLTLNRRFEGAAHNVGSWVTPAVVLTLFAFGILVATAPYR